MKQKNISSLIFEKKTKQKTANNHRTRTMETDIEAVLVPQWKGLGQGQHTEGQKKVSEYLKSVQTVLENLANKVKKLEQDNLALNRENESLRNKLENGGCPKVAAEKWSNFLKKGSYEKSSHEEVMIVEKMFVESKARLEKANNVVISGVPTHNVDDKNDEQIVTDILEVIGIQNPENKVKKVFRMAKTRNQVADNKPPPIVVELCDKETQTRLLKNAKNLKDSTSFNKCFINPDLTRNEMEIERELRRRRNLENDKLNLGEGRLKYGELEDGTRFYWGIRFGKLCRVNRETKRALPPQ